MHRWLGHRLMSTQLQHISENSHHKYLRNTEEDMGNVLLLCRMYPKEKQLVQLGWQRYRYRSIGTGCFVVSNPQHHTIAVQKIVICASRVKGRP